MRYLGINTPEIGQPYAEEARAYNEALVAGREVWLETDAQETDQYGRLLAYVWLGDRDTAYLYDATGALVDRYSYTS